MKKRSYETPAAEKVAFQYQEQVVASNQNCTSQWTNIGYDTCNEFEQVRNFNQ